MGQIYAMCKYGWTPLGGVEVVRIFLSVEHIQMPEIEKARLRCI
jgi:hypothetical protein